MARKDPMGYFSRRTRPDRVSRLTKRPGYLSSRDDLLDFRRFSSEIPTKPYEYRLLRTLLYR